MKLQAILRVILTGALIGVGARCIIADDDPPPLTEVRIRSSLDGSLQPALLHAPEKAKSETTPLFVFLHSWSGDYTQKRVDWRLEAAERGWIYIQPNFRGRNDHPEACGSELARRDVLDAVDYVKANYRVDGKRIYLAGVSGGGHMAMLMAGRHADRFSAVSAWVGISDLADWHRFHTKGGKKGRYAEMIEASCGGPPGASKTVDAEYRARSPIHFLHRAVELPLDLNAGVRDGKDGSVPIHHTLRAFNTVAKAGRHGVVAESEMNHLWTHGSLARPRPSDEVVDETYDRKILLRRRAGPCRVTIFDGGHEARTKAAVAWLEKQSRETR